MSSVQTLETMRKLNEIKSYVRNTLDKLLGVRGNLIRSNDSWQYYGFCELVEALRKWTDRNLKIIASAKNPEGDNAYHTKERESKQPAAVSFARKTAINRANVRSLNVYLTASQKF